MSCQFTNPKSINTNTKEFIAEFQKSKKTNQYGQLSLGSHMKEVSGELFGVASIWVLIRM